MRVVAGVARGRKLTAPPGNHVRPTGARVREAVFNALHSLDAIVDARVLDLFAGSGALGIEALSRGAAHATFVEPDAAARHHVRANLAATDLTHVATVEAMRAERFLERTTGVFDLVLCDPPYAYDAWGDLRDALTGVVALDGVVVIESDTAVDGDVAWEILRQRRYGGTVVTVMTPTSDQATRRGRPA